jgi:caffeoyl-CoA O-methyltransferase
MSGKYVTLNDTIYNYLVAQRSNAHDPLLHSLHLETQSLGDAGRMAIGPEQGSLISMLVALIGAKYAIEVGTFTGTSSICIARYLAPGGKLVCFDQDFKYTSIARRYWIRAGIQDRIDLRLGDARRLVPHFRPQQPIDFVFIDADKESYDSYYEMLVPYVRTGGLILFDNMLRGGEVADPVARNTPMNKAIDVLNRKLAVDTRVQSVMLPIADGLTICRKLGTPTSDSGRVHDSRRISEARRMGDFRFG